MTTMADVIREKETKEQACARVAGMRRDGTIANGRDDGKDVYIYVEAGGSGMLRVRYVTTDYWVNTDGNGGYGQSWCCCADTPTYIKE